MPFEIRDLDTRVYEQHLSGFLPDKMIDIHTHVWLRSFVVDPTAEGRGAQWPSRVAEENSVEDLLRTYELLLPKQRVSPLLFGSPRRGISLDMTNDYVQESAQRYHLAGLLVSTPEWPADLLERKVRQGGFLGLKPYLSFAPAHIPEADITIYDFLPRAHLHVANAHGWLVMLHLPRKDRLRDPVNLQALLEIERSYPNVRLVVAHIGRAYCPEDVGDAMRVLQGSKRLLFDFSANTNAWVMEQLIRAVGPERILFGSDLPIPRMRMRRVCEDGRYINLVPPGLYGDVSGDPHMREVSQLEGERLSFFMYEELIAFRRAAEATGLDRTDLEGIFFGNAANVIAGIGRHLPKDVPWIC